MSYFHRGEEGRTAENAFTAARIRPSLAKHASITTQIAPSSPRALGGNPSLHMETSGCRPNTPHSATIPADIFHAGMLRGECPGMTVFSPPHSLLGFIQWD
jgi:hypothetical protein